MVGPDRPLAMVHARDRAAADEAEAALKAAVEVGRATVPHRPVIAGRIA
jgi:thymidine phosphorylase